MDPARYGTLTVTPNEPLGKFELPVLIALGSAVLHVLIPKGGICPQRTKQELFLCYVYAWALQVSCIPGPEGVGQSHCLQRDN